MPRPAKNNPKQTPKRDPLRAEVAALQLRLKEAEQTLTAIRNGEVDALVVGGSNDKRIYTLQGADEPYRLMVERMHEGAVTILLEGTILYANHHFAQMVGQSLEKVIGTNVWEHLKPEGTDGACNPLAGIGQGREQELPPSGCEGGNGGAAGAENRDLGWAGVNDMRKEFALRRSGGKSLPVQVSASIIEFQTVRCFCLVVTDLTQQRRQEEARRNEAHLRMVTEALEQRVEERTQEVQHRLGQLQSLALELSRAEHRVRKRLAKTLHDGLQQLLVAATMRVTAIESDLQSEEARHDMDQLRHILTQSIELSRSLTAELSPPVLYTAGLPAALDWLARWMEENHCLKVVVYADGAADPDDDDLRVFLFEAAREALLNVTKYAGVDRARIGLARAGENHIRLSVEDEGKGFDPATLGARWKTSGGYGLMSIRERLSLLGGQMEIESFENKDGAGEGRQGTRVSLVCPIHHIKNSVVVTVTPPREPATPAPVPASGKIRLIIADDHKIVRQGLVALLSRWPEIQVVGEAADGLQALELARELRPDVVLMDVDMPVMDGIEATRRITAELPDIQVIGLSMHTEPELRSKMTQAGAADYHSKDGPTEGLIGAIRRCCAQMHAAEIVEIERK